MADFIGLECDICRSREDGVRRLPIADQEIDLCPGCWAKHNLDDLLEHARPATVKSNTSGGRRVPLDATRRIRNWCQANHIELSRGQTPATARDAWLANDPSMMSDRYMGDGEPPSTGVMPADARPPGWTESTAEQGLGGRRRQ
jgi:hypothetical protein